MNTLDDTPRCYVVCGLRISSELPLELPEVGGITCDIRVTKGNVEFHEASMFDEEIEIEVCQSGVKVRRHAVGVFLIRGGCEIIFQPEHNVDLGKFSYCMLSSILAIALQQRGILVLHGGAVKMFGHGIAFVGANGSGKSTLVTSLSLRGFEIITDDLLAVEANDAFEIQVWPTFAQVYIWPDSYVMIPGRTVRTGDESKHRYVPKSHSTQAIPLMQVYVIEPATELTIVPLSADRSMIELIRHSYLVRVQNLLNVVGPHLELCAAVARTVSVATLKMPHNYASLDGVCDAIEAHSHSSRLLQSLSAKR